MKNPNIALTIFVSHQKPSTSGKPSRTQGVQVSGTCKRIIKKGEFEFAMQIVYLKRFSDEEERKKHNISIEHFMKDEGRTNHIYKIIPEHFYILDKKNRKRHSDGSFYERPSIDLNTRIQDSSSAHTATLASNLL